MKLSLVFVFMLTCSCAFAKQACVSLLDSTAGLTFTAPKNDVVRALNEVGDQIGEFEYDYTPETNDLHIGEARVADKYSGRGVYRKMLKLVLEKHPEVRTITASLQKDNLFEYTKAKRALLRDRSLGLSLEEAGWEALKSTPAYKIRKAMGFSKIIEHVRREPDRTYMSDSGSLRFVVERDESF